MGNHAVHVHSSLGSESLSHSDGDSLIGVELCGSDHADLFELHQAVANAFSSCFAGVFRQCSSAVSGAVVLAEAVDSNLFAHVELVCD